MDGLEGTTTEDIQLPSSTLASNEQNYAQTPPRKRRGTTAMGESPQIYEQLTPIASVTPSVKNTFFSPMSRDASIFKSPFMTPSRFGSPPSKSRDYPFTSPTAMTSSAISPERSPCPSSFADPSIVPSTPDYNTALINTNTTNIQEKVNDHISSNIIESTITPINNRRHSNNNKINATTPNNTTTPSSTNSSMCETPSSVNMSINSSNGGLNDLPIKCNCKKSKCLKLYCECFSALEYCDGCNCINCLNTHEHEKDREAAIKVTRERNNTAFTPKVCEKSSENHTFIHTKGCRCKKSNCLKKYCECYQHGVACTDGCKCCECKNKPVDSNNNSNGNNSQKSSKKHLSKTPNSSRIKISSSSSSVISSLNSSSIISNVSELRLFGREYPIFEIKILEHIWSYLPSDDMIISSKVNKNWLKMAFIMKEKEKQNNYL